MDWMDFILKFSGELLVVVLSLAVAGLNLFYFGGGRQLQDKSLAGNFLSRHAQLNPKLYNKNNSIITVLEGGGIFPRAEADSFTGLDPQGMGAGDASLDNSDIIIGDESTILAPNPDSVQGLIAKQIKIHQTQNGDTLKSIAQDFGISQKTIMWANKLASPNIKPGWQLIILPTDGVLVKATSNDTLPDIAAKYNPQRYNSNKTIRDETADKLLETIISYNALEDAEDIDAGQLIIVPGGVVSEPPQPKPAPKPKAAAGSGASDVITSVGSGYDGINHLFPKGFCTYYVAGRMKITFGGNAKNWLANAKASGYVTGKEPAPHSAVVTTDSRRWGHVAFVEEVTDTAILVSEMNFERFNRVNQRWISINSPKIRGYIYP